MTHAPRIVIVTPNPAVDITYEVTSPILGETNRVVKTTRRAGGKGLNVASVLGQLGVNSTVCGFLGSSSGQEIYTFLSQWPFVEQAWLNLGEGYRTRSTVAVSAADGSVTMLNEPGPETTSQQWNDLIRLIDSLTSQSDVLVISGSCPPGTLPEHLRTLLLNARSKGVRTILDTSGPLLAQCAQYADACKPNREEIVQAMGVDDVSEAARMLLDSGSRSVVVSDGPHGMNLLTKQGEFHADSPAVHVVNPTGAGDSAVAALAAHYWKNPDSSTVTPEALADAVALSTAAVLTHTAGTVDVDAYRQFSQTVRATVVE